MAFFFGGPDDKGPGWVPPTDGDGEGPGGFNFFGPPGGDGPEGDMPWMEPGEAMDADDLFMMFAGPEGDDDFGPPGGDGPEGGFRGFFGPQGDDGFGPPNPDGDFEEGPRGGIASVFGLSGESSQPEEAQQEAAQTFFFGEKQAEPIDASAGADAPAANSDAEEAEEEQTFFTAQDAEVEEENTFFNPEAQEELEEAPQNTFFAFTSPQNQQAPQASFFNPGGAAGLVFGGGSGGSGNEAQADSELERDSEQEFESDND